MAPNNDRATADTFETAANRHSQGSPAVPNAGSTAANLHELRRRIDDALASMPTRQAKHATATLVLDWALEHDSLGYDPSREEAYLVFDERAFVLDCNGAEQALYRLGLTPDEAVGRCVIRALRMSAEEDGRRKPLANWSGHDHTTGQVYVSCGPKVVVRAPEAQLVPNGTDGKWFAAGMTLPKWVPDAYPPSRMPQALRPLTTSGSWAGYTAARQDLLAAAWLEALLAGIRPLPMLSVQGPRGTGKSTLARAILGLLLGDGQQPIPMPRERRDFEQAVSSLPLVALDNIDEGLPKWFPDTAASVLTGATIRRRRQRTDAGTFQAPAPAGLLVTSRTGIHLRDDLRDRALPIYLAEPPERGSDEAMVREVVENRDRLLTSLVEHGAAALARMPAVVATVPTRFTDFGRFVVAGWGQPGREALEALEAQQILLDGGIARLYRGAAQLPPDPTFGSAFLRGTAREILDGLGETAGLSASERHELRADEVVGDLAKLLALQGWRVERTDGDGELASYRLAAPVQRCVAQAEER